MCYGGVLNTSMHAYACIVALLHISLNTMHIRNYSCERNYVNG